VEPDVKIQQHASNIGNIKGLPKGSGHGGYTIDSQPDISTNNQIRIHLTNGSAIHITDKEDSDYIIKDLVGGDKLDAYHICPVKLNTAIDNNHADSLDDIASSIDTLLVTDITIKNIFDDEEDAINYFLMSVEQIEYESLSTFDRTLNEIYKRIIN